MSSFFRIPLYNASVVQLLWLPPGVNAATIPVGVDEEWLAEFRRATKDWASTNDWLAADEPWAVTGLATSTPAETRELWRPGGIISLTAFWAAPTTLALANRLLREGRDLAELPWRNFEELVADLLSAEGWIVRLTPESGDGGVDVFAVRDDPVVGPILTVWQAKRYAPHRKVGIGAIRELITVREEHQASKAFVVTTSTLTKGALTRIAQEDFRLGAMQGPDLTSWVDRVSKLPPN